MSGYGQEIVIRSFVQARPSCGAAVGYGGNSGTPSAPRHL